MFFQNGYDWDLQAQLFYIVTLGVAWHYLVARPYLEAPVWVSTPELCHWNGPPKRHSQGHMGFVGRREEAPRTGKGGSNPSLALPVWTLVEKASARNNLWGFSTFLDLCQSYFFSGVLYGRWADRKWSYVRPLISFPQEPCVTHLTDMHTHCKYTSAQGPRRSLCTNKPTWEWRALAQVKGDMIRIDHAGPMDPIFCKLTLSKFLRKRQSVNPASQKLRKEVSGGRIVPRAPELAHWTDTSKPWVWHCIPHRSSEAKDLLTLNPAPLCKAHRQEGEAGEIFHGAAKSGETRSQAETYLAVISSSYLVFRSNNSVRVFSRAERQRT